MIASLRGVLTHKDDQGAVIECSGVGYGVAASVPTLMALGSVGQEVRLHVYTHVAEDALKLYGFATVMERSTFEVLLGTSGVGPRLALAILSTLTSEQLLLAVQRKERGALTRISGVGPKKADRLLLELTGRLGHMHAPQVMGTRQVGDCINDVASALTHLGFGLTQAADGAQAASVALPDCTDVATLTRHALQQMSKRSKGHGAH